MLPLSSHCLKYLCHYQSPTDYRRSLSSRRSLIGLINKKDNMLPLLSHCLKNPYHYQSPRVLLSPKTKELTHPKSPLGLTKHPLNLSNKKAPFGKGDWDLHWQISGGLTALTLFQSIPYYDRQKNQNVAI